MQRQKHSALALAGGKPAVTMKSPAWPVAGHQELIWMEQVVRSGKWSWLGPHETAFCKEYAKFISSKYCVCLANGTVTLQCALQAVLLRGGLRRLERQTALREDNAQYLVAGL